ncbi:hypothetical protein Hypma_012000 [Hypsizygus marmoreus]|uniref:G domain-containing protein n=1 Tax=Hypsizygus marmoreus TaxID=39966 RepID=A0A369JFH4_HYPMA|nr:hypothetical protein Hypma_012000 [Hypsizygus marmoreus]
MISADDTTGDPLPMQQQHLPPPMPSEYFPSGTLSTEIPPYAARHVNAPQPPQDFTSNIIIFGEKGVGKSSLISMITGGEMGVTSSELFGCTFEAVPACTILIAGKRCRLWDTTGFNEGGQGTVPAEQTEKNLRDLVEGLAFAGGVNLLVHCFRGTRFRDIVKINYDMFFKVICGGNVPIVAVVTGLENEEPMEAWWTANEEELKSYGLNFEGHACVATTRGKMMKTGQWMFEEEYEQSKEAARNLIFADFTPKAGYVGMMGDVLRRFRRVWQIYIESASTPTDHPRKT